MSHASWIAWRIMFSLRSNAERERRKEAAAASSAALVVTTTAAERGCGSSGRFGVLAWLDARALDPADGGVVPLDVGIIIPPGVAAEAALGGVTASGVEQEDTFGFSEMGALSGMEARSLRCCEGDSARGVVVVWWAMPSDTTVGC